MTTNLTESNIDSAVLQAPGTHVIRFWASWCKPCTMILPIYLAIAEELKDQAHFAEVDIDQQGPLAARFGIRSIPTIVIVKEGQAVDGNVGLMDKGRLRELVTRNLA